MTHHNRRSEIEAARAFLGERFLPPKPKSAIAGYNSFDIAFAQSGIETLRDLFLSGVKGYLDSNEHVASMVNFESFAAGLRDMVTDELTGPLQHRIDELRGDR